MRSSFQNIFFAALVLFSSCMLVSCDKVDVTFGNVYSGTDPDVTYYQNYQVDLQTVQVDSFLTSNQSTFTVGHNQDPLFGAIQAGTFAQFDLTPINPLLLAKNVTYDSVDLIIRSNANSYGDTTLPFYFKIHPLTQL